ncbi:MAG: LptE family protein [Kiritimatiellae bacterium]|nr:LptE family protein [Kiritimatiellia bacterium]
MKTIRGSNLIITALSLLIGAGCSNYRMQAPVPDELRTIAVPVFENASGFPEIDAIVTQEVLREFQREGTFKLARLENASLKLLGKLEDSKTQPLNYDRNFSSRTSEYRLELTARITLVERGSGRLLIDDMPVKANTTFLTRGDMLTGLQDAQPRVAKDLARAIADAVLAYWPESQ